MNNLKVFENSEFGKLEVLMVNGKEYFPATKCAKVLGHENPERAVRRYCKGVTKMVTPTDGGFQEINYIPEGDLYRLIIRSKLPSAERFERWVMEEVLPSIHQTGGYGNLNIEEIITKTAIAVATEVTKSLLSKEVEQVQFPAIEKPKKRTNANSIISKLTPELQNDVDSMLLSGNFTYIQIREYLKDYDVSISLSSIQRRYAKLIKG